MNVKEIEMMSIMDELMEHSQGFEKHQVKIKGFKLPHQAVTDLKNSKNILPVAIQLVSVIMIILGYPKEKQEDWDSQKALLSDPAALEKRLVDYPIGAGNIDMIYAVKQRVTEYGKEHYHPNLVGNLGEACVAFCQYSLDWIEAV